MTIQGFNLLSFKQQRTFVLMRGRYLATRWQEPDETMKLFQMPEGFFVELTFTPTTHGAQYLFAFEAGSEYDRLPDYAMFVKLPDWMPESK